MMIIKQFSKKELAMQKLGLVKSSTSSEVYNGKIQKQAN